MDLSLASAAREQARNAIPSERTLLIVEDDKSFLARLAKALESRGFTVTTAESVAEGLAQLEHAAPAFAVVDMRLNDGNGLDVISALKRRRPDARAIILTGYGNIATAVTAVKLGAVDYLAKPADADDVIAALLALEPTKTAPPENPMSADRVRWEHIQRIYEMCGRNVSETARRLNMHRRTLQRILAKRAALTVPRIGAVVLTAWLMSAAPALASANVSCRIDDRVMALEFEAIPGRTSPINQVHSGIITLKPAAKLKLSSPQLKFGIEQIVQQWMLDGDMRLQIEVSDDTARESINLVIVASLERRQEKYFGRYVLTVTQNGEPKAFKGRIKECLAG